ncbi:MAG: hypothetical protein HC921_22475 [Synechococcaceae cyanobacterium SM2_3_1]|nr:hypothetical protein [Synechococcaceae cyanobacterium SM2_3_1]
MATKKLSINKSTDQNFILPSFDLTPVDFIERSNESEETYRSLLRSLKRKKGFGLFFAVDINETKREEVANKVKNDLPNKNICSILLDEKSIRLFDLVSDLYKQDSPDIIIIKGLEKALYSYEDTKLNFEGWGYKDLAYSWKDVPPILSHLNQQRERFASEFPCIFLFLIPPWCINYLVRRALIFLIGAQVYFSFL